MEINNSNFRLTLQRAGAQWIASFTLELGGTSETISGTLVVPAMPDATVAQVEQEVLKLTIAKLQRLTR